MQTKYFIFFKKVFLILLLLLQLLDSKAQKKIIIQADSLFSQRNFETAKTKYEEIIQKNQFVNSSTFLKLAYIYESSSDFPQALYYLNLYYSKHPDEKIFNKMNKIAEKNNLKGYEKNDLNFIILLYRRYSTYLLGIFLALGIYIFGVLVYKKLNKQVTQKRHYIIFMLYIILLALLINIPENYRSVIIKNDNAYLRDYPSSASPVMGNINQGHRLNVLDSEDIWYHVLWEGRLVYIKATDVWLIK